MSFQTRWVAALVALLARPAAARGGSPFTDYRAEKPGLRHHITVNDLPAPYDTPDVNNGPSLVEKPKDAWPRVPPGFKVELYSDDLKNPRLIRTAPNGDLFVAESGPGRIKIFRGITKDGKPETTAVFASGLNKPFGISFYPPGPDPKFVYVGDTDAVVRFPYANGDLKASGPFEGILKVPAGGSIDGGHWTRDVVFSKDGAMMYVSVGSRSNVGDTDGDPSEFHRADILEADPDGRNLRVYASGIRNAVGLTVEPKTGLLWASVNERDRLGDNLPPDYITHVEDGGFYGWPWYYTGPHQDPRHAGKHPELKDKVIVPDVLLEPHNASLELTVYGGKQFPAEYTGDIFAAEHGSWNRSVRTGYEIIRVRLKDGRAAGDYEDFLTGFVRPDGQVWGRPVGVAVAADGSLMLSDDGGNRLWRISYAGTGAK